jgi:hypothetical protein
MSVIREQMIALRWEAREEQPKEMANRFLALLKSLSEAAAVGAWFLKGSSKLEALMHRVDLQDPNALSEELEQRRSEAGYGIGVWSGGDEASAVAADLWCGAPKTSLLVESLQIDVPSIYLKEANIWRSLFIELLEIWRPKIATMVDREMRKRFTAAPHSLVPGWLYYASTRGNCSATVPEGWDCAQMRRGVLYTHGRFLWMDVDKDVETTWRLRAVVPSLQRR